MEHEIEKLETLKELIKESEKKIKEKGQSISKLDQDLSQLRTEINFTEEKLLKFKKVKILTRKQLEQIRKEKLEKAKIDFENQKINIGRDTQKAFEKAKKIREKASNKSLEEYELAKIKARNIEVEALKKEVFILNCIIGEKEKQYEDMLAKKACVEINNKFKDKNENVSFITFNLKNLSEVCKRLKKEIYDLNMRIKRSVIKLKSC